VIRFTLPGLPPSTNNLYLTTGKGRRIKTPLARSWSEEAGWRMIAQRGVNRVARGADLAVAVRLYGRWRDSAGKHRRIDASNRVKILEDVAASVLHFDDRQVYRLSVEKIEAAAERTELDIWELAEVPF
jgi:Holliday junction resolvase RusA-like endonuclease